MGQDSVITTEGIGQLWEVTHSVRDSSNQCSADGLQDARLSVPSFSGSSETVDYSTDESSKSVIYPSMFDKSSKSV